MSCAICDREQRKGEYDFHCLDCCVELVFSARPNRQLAESMLHAIRNYHNRQTIIERMKCQKYQSQKSEPK